MGTGQIGNQDGGAVIAGLEEAASFGPEAVDSETLKAMKLVSFPVFLQLKETLAMDEIRMRRMKKGENVSRSQFIAEAIRLRVQAESSSKNAGRTA